MLSLEVLRFSMIFISIVHILYQERCIWEAWISRLIQGESNNKRSFVNTWEILGLKSAHKLYCGFIMCLCGEITLSLNMLVSNFALTSRLHFLFCHGFRNCAKICSNRKPDFLRISRFSVSQSDLEANWFTAEFFSSQ